MHVKGKPPLCLEAIVYIFQEVKWLGNVEVKACSLSPLLFPRNHRDMTRSSSKLLFLWNSRPMEGAHREVTGEGMQLTEGAVKCNQPPCLSL